MGQRPDINTELSAERERHRRLIREAALRHGVEPDLLEAATFQESGFNKDAVSPAGAAGIGQFMPKTGRSMGLSPEERFDPVKAADAMARHFRENLDRYDGDVDLALGAYNAGVGTADRVAHARRQGRAADWPRQETRDYIPAIKSHFDKIRQVTRPRERDPFADPSPIRPERAIAPEAPAPPVRPPAVQAAPSNLAMPAPPTQAPRSTFEAAYAPQPAAESGRPIEPQAPGYDPVALETLRPAPMPPMQTAGPVRATGYGPSVAIPAAPLAPGAEVAPQPPRPMQQARRPVRRRPAAPASGGIVGLARRFLDHDRGPSGFTQVSRPVRQDPRAMRADFEDYGPVPSAPRPRAPLAPRPADVFTAQAAPRPFVRPRPQAPPVVQRPADVLKAPKLIPAPADVFAREAAEAVRPKSQAELEQEYRDARMFDAMQPKSREEEYSRYPNRAPEGYFGDPRANESWSEWATRMATTPSNPTMPGGILGNVVTDLMAPVKPLDDETRAAMAPREQEAWDNSSLGKFSRIANSIVNPRAAIGLAATDDIQRRLETPEMQQAMVDIGITGSPLENVFRGAMNIPGELAAGESLNYLRPRVQQKANPNAPLPGAVDVIGRGANMLGTTPATVGLMSIAAPAVAAAGATGLGAEAATGALALGGQELISDQPPGVPYRETLAERMARGQGGAVMGATFAPVNRLVSPLVNPLVRRAEEAIGKTNFGQKFIEPLAVPSRVASGASMVATGYPAAAIMGQPAPTLAQGVENAILGVVSGPEFNRFTGATAGPSAVPDAPSVEYQRPKAVPEGTPPIVFHTTGPDGTVRIGVYEAPTKAGAPSKWRTLAAGEDPGAITADNAVEVPADQFEQLFPKVRDAKAAIIRERTRQAIEAHRAAKVDGAIEQNRAPEPEPTTPVVDAASSRSRPTPEAIEPGMQPESITVNDATSATGDQPPNAGAREPWQMTRDEAQQAARPHNRETIEASRPVLAEYPELAASVDKSIAKNGVNTEDATIAPPDKTAAKKPVDEMTNDERRENHFEDELTGVWNARVFHRTIDAANADPSTAVAILDGDNFGKLNKLESQAAGDVEIARMGASLRQAADEVGIEHGGRRVPGVVDGVIRMGGDEFALIGPKELVDAARARAEEIYGTRMAEGEDEFGFQRRVPITLTGSTDVTRGRAERRLQAMKQGKKGRRKIEEEAPVAQIRVDPKRFQFKGGYSESGATGSITGKYDPGLVGLLTVWRDPADRQIYVVNGHNRLDAARRAGAESVPAKFLDPKLYPTAEAARAQGAWENIASGDGTALDAAKWLRASGLPLEEAKAKLPLSKATVRDGLDLAALDETAFGLVANGAIPEWQGAAIGRGIKDPDLQLQTLKSLAATNQRKTLTHRDVDEIIESIAAAPLAEQTTMSLFGDQTEARSLVVERAGVTEYVRSEIENDRRAFGGAVRNKAKLESGGSSIDKERAVDLATSAKEALGVFKTLKNRSGPIAEVLDDAARQIADGKSASTVKADAYKRIRPILDSELGGSPQDALPGTGSRGTRGGGKTAPKPKAAEPAVEPVKPPAAERSSPLKSGDRPSDRVIAKLDALADEARANLKKSLGGVKVGIPPEAIGHLAVLAAAKIARQGVKSVQWASDLVREFGEEIRPELARIRAKAMRLLDREAKAAFDVPKGKSGLEALRVEQERAGSVEPGAEYDPAALESLRPAPAERSTPLKSGDVEPWARTRTEHLDVIAETTGIAREDVETIEKIVDDDGRYSGRRTRAKATPGEMRRLAERGLAEPWADTSGAGHYLTDATKPVKQAILRRRSEVEAALAAGKPVSDAVRAEYPDLAKAAAPKPPAPKPVKAPTPPKSEPAPKITRESIRQDWIDKFDLTPEKADAITTLLDARAETWAKAHGKKPADYFTSRFAGIEKGGTPGESALESRSRKAGLSQAEQVQTPEFKRFFRSSKVTTPEGSPRVVYRGDFRADKVGATLKKSRATSGRFYFTEDPSVASGYAEGKQYVPDDFTEMDRWYSVRVGPGKRDVTRSVSDAWYQLSAEQKARVKDVLTKAGDPDTDDGGSAFDFSGDNPIVGADHWGREVRANHGNWLAAGVDVWLRSGALYGQEERFLEVLQKAGLSADYDNPATPRSGLTPVYLSIQRPLDTSAIPADVIEAIRKTAKADRTRSTGSSFDQWDKRVNSKEFLAALENDLREGTSNAWTTVPEKITETLKRLGYDGIKDTGGKNGGQEHAVWIAFEPTQVKSALGNKGTFDPDSPNILRQDPETGPRLVALHNTSADGILASAEMGGIPSPSLAVLPEGSEFKKFGEVTLVGRRDLVDPEADARNQLHAADMYSPRQATPEYNYNKKAKFAFETDPELTKAFNDVHESSTYLDLNSWSSKADKRVAVDRIASRDGARLAFIRSKGEDVPIARRPATPGFSRIEPVDIELLKGEEFPDNTPSEDMAEYGRIEKAFRRVLTAAHERAGIMDKLPRSLDLLTNGDPDGQVVRHWLDVFLRDVKRVRSGETVIDEAANREAIAAKVAELGGDGAVRDWIAEKLDPVYTAPFITKGRRKLPFTAENVLDDMVSRKQVGGEKTMTKGLGEAKAAGSKPLRTIEDARAASGAIKPRAEADSVYQRNNDELKEIAELIAEADNSGGSAFGTMWESLDGVGGALKRYLAGNARTENAMRSAYAKEHFVIRSPEIIKRSMELAKAVEDSPVEYFESKPRRVVGLGEFAGAVVPDDMPAKARKALEDAGLRIETYSRDDDSTRAAAVAKFSDALFQAAYHGSPHTFDKFSLHKIGTGEGNQAFGWGLYFASKKDVAEGYRKMLTADEHPTFKALTEEENAKLPDWVARGIAYDSDVERIHTAIDRQIADFQKRLADAERELNPPKPTAEQTAADRAAGWGKLAEWTPPSQPWLIENRIKIARDVLATLEKLKAGGNFEAEVNKGRLYKVDIPEDPDFLDYDRPLARQSEKVKSILRAAGHEIGDFTYPTLAAARRRYLSKRVQALYDSDIGIRESLMKAWYAIESGDVKAFERWYDESGGLMFPAETDAEQLGRTKGSTFYDQIGLDATKEDKTGRSFGNRAELGSKALAELGIAGIKYADGTTRGRGFDRETHNYVVFDDNLVKIMEMDQAERIGEGAKASVEFLHDGRAIIRALTKPDFSSAVHEVGHVFRRDLDGEDLRVTEEWAGVKDGNWKVANEEKFARGFERYLRDGRAPTTKLAGVFEKFKTWLTDIYKSLKGSPIDVKLSPAMREVFDRMLGAEGAKPVPVAPERPGKAIDPTKVTVDEGMTSLVHNTPQERLRAIEDAARARAKEKLRNLASGTLSSGIDPTIIADLVVVGAAKLARKSIDFATWSKEMVADFGEAVRPHLKAIYAGARTERKAMLEDSKPPAKDTFAGAQAERFARFAARESEAAKRVTELDAEIRLAKRPNVKSTPASIEMLVRERAKWAARLPQIVVAGRDVPDLRFSRADDPTMAGSIARLDIRGREVTDGPLTFQIYQRPDGWVLNSPRGQSVHLDRKAAVAEAQRIADTAARDLAPLSGTTPQEKLHTVERDRRIRAHGKLRLMAKGEQTNAFLPVDVIADLVSVGAAKLARHGFDFIDFARDMKAEFGEKIVPDMREIYDGARLKQKELERAGAYENEPEPDWIALADGEWNPRTSGLPDEYRQEFARRIVEARPPEGYPRETVESHDAVKAARDLVGLDEVVELGKWKRGEAVPVKHVVLAAKDYAESLSRQADDLFQRAEVGVDADGDALHPIEREEMLAHAEELEAASLKVVLSVIPIKTEMGRALAALKIKVNAGMSAERGIQMARRLARSSGHDVESKSWKETEAKIGKVAERDRRTKKNVDALVEALRRGGIDPTKLVRSDDTPVSAAEAVKVVRESVAKAPREPKPATPGRKPFHEEVRERAIARGQAAMERIRARRAEIASGKLSAGPGAVAEFFPDIVEVVASWLVEKSITRSEIARRLVDEWGDDIKPHIDRIRAQAFRANSDIRRAVRRERDIEDVTQGKPENFTEDEVEALLGELEAERQADRERVRDLKRITPDDADPRVHANVVTELPVGPSGAGHRARAGRGNYKSRLAAREAIARRRLADPEYAQSDEALDDVAMVGASKLTDPNMTRERWAKEMADEFGDSYTRRREDVIAAAGHYFNEARELDTGRQTERAATKGHGDDLTPEETTKLVRDFVAAKKAHAEARRELFKALSAVQKQTVVDKILLIRKAGLLTGVKTTTRNLVGTIGFAVGQEELARIPSSIVDAAVGAFTHRRTVTGPDLAAMRQAFTEARTKGVAEALEIMKHGATKEQLDRLEISREFQTKSKLLGLYVNGVFRFMSAQDRIIKSYVIRRALEGGAKAQALTERKQGVTFHHESGDRPMTVAERAKYLVDNPPENLVADAILEADYSTFNSENVVANAYNSARGKLRSSGAVGRGIAAGADILAPFVRTPSNILARILDYSPAGVAVDVLKAVHDIHSERKAGEFIEVWSPQRQQDFARGIGRASLGTAIMIIGAGLFKMGLLSGSRDDDPSKRERDYTTGRQPMALKVGGDWQNIGTLSPFGNLLTMGATLMREHDQIRRDPSVAMQRMASAAGATVIEQPMLKGTKDLLEALNRPGSAGSKLTGGAMASIIPTFVSDFSHATDWARRDTRGVAPAILGRTPARTILPESFDALGRPAEHRRTNAINALMPSLARGDTDPVDHELERLDVGISRPKPKPGEPADTYRERDRAVGAERYKRLTKVTTSPSYQRMPEDEQRKVVEQTLRDAAEDVNKRYKLPAPAAP